MAEAGDLEAASAGLAAALRERSMDGHLRLDDYMQVVEEVAEAHGHDRDALHEHFAANEGRDMTVVLSGAAAGP